MSIMSRKRRLMHRKGAHVQEDSCPGRGGGSYSAGAHVQEGSDVHHVPEGGHMFRGGGADAEEGRLKHIKVEVGAFRGG